MWAGRGGVLSYCGLTNTEESRRGLSATLFERCLEDEVVGGRYPLTRDPVGNSRRRFNSSQLCSLVVSSEGGNDGFNRLEDDCRLEFHTP